MKKKITTMIIKPNITKDAEHQKIVQKNPAHVFKNKKAYTRKSKYMPKYEEY